MKDYKKKYEDLRKNIEHMYESVNLEWKRIIECYIPEIKECEDEEIRKELIKLMKQMSNTIVENYTTIEISTFVAWLEKQTIDISSFPEEQRKYMEKYVNLDKTTLVKLLAERDENIDESLKACDDPTLNCETYYQKQEWSEEDEIYLQDVVEWVTNYIDDEDCGNMTRINWLKSLKEKCTWKPSKEQIIALRWALNNVPYNKHKEELVALLDQIKNL